MRQQMASMGGAGAPGMDMQKAFDGERAALELVRKLTRQLTSLPADLHHACILTPLPSVPSIRKRSGTVMNIAYYYMCLWPCIVDGAC